MKIPPITLVPGSPLSPPRSAAPVSPTLGGNFVSMARAVKEPWSNQGFEGFLVRWLAAKMRGLAPRIHEKMAPDVPGDQRLEHFHRIVTEGVESVPFSAPDPKEDPRGEEYYLIVAGAVLHEYARLAAPYCLWQDKIDKAIAETAKAPLGDHFSIKDWIRIPLDLAESSLPDDQKIGLLTHARTQLERLPDAEAIKGVPLLAAVIVAAYRLKDAKLVQEGFGLLEILVEASTAPNDTFHVLKGAIEVFRENGSSEELIPRVLLILKEFLLNLLKVDRGEMQFWMLGEASRTASSLGDQSLALLLAQKRVDLALFLIQKRQDKPPAQRTAGYGAVTAAAASQIVKGALSSPDDTHHLSPYRDLGYLDQVFKEARLDPDLKQQLFEHACKATELLVEDGGLKNKVLSYLNLLSVESPGQ